MRAVPLVVAVVVAALPVTASADVFKLFGELHGGGMDGVGASGDLKDSAFFQKAKGGAYGAEIGVELLFLDVWIQHHQYINGDGLKTWTQFGLGIHFTIDLGTTKEIKAHSGTYIELGAGVWYGVGTGAQVMPPLNAAQISDQGFLGEGRLGFGKHLSSVFDIGIEVPVSYGYFFDKAAGPANDLSTHYRGYEAEGLVVLRANLRVL